MKYVLSAFVRLYQILTFWKPPVCIYIPSCSNYMLIALKKWGALKGLWLGIKRIMRCVPWKEGGVDPVPDNPKGPMKWLM